MKKRLFCITMVVIMVFSIFATGCGKKVEEKNGGATTSVKDETSSKDEPTAEPTEEPLEPVELSMYFIGTNEMVDDKLVEGEINRLIKDKINATVKLNFMDWGSYEEKMNLLLASGEPVDILFQANWLGASYSNNVSKGFLYDITDIVDTYAKGAREVVPEFLFDGVSINGKIYGMPTYKEVGSSNGVVFVKEIVDQLGIDVSTIKTLADVEAALVQIKEAYPERVTLMGNPPNTDGRNWSYPAGYGIPLAIAYDGTEVTLMTESEDYINACLRSKKYNDMGYYPKDYLTAFDPKAVFKSGKASVMQIGLKPGKDKELSVEYGVEVVQAELTDVYVDANEGSGSILSIGANSLNPERALMFIDLLFTDQQLINKLAFGVENVHWKKVNDNTVDYPEGVSADNIGYSHAISWQFGNQYLNYLWPNEAPDKWEKFKAYADVAVSPKIMGFSFNGESVKTQLSAVTNVSDQYAAVLEKGMSTDIVGDMAKYTKALKVAGIDVIREEMQRQIDEFMAK